MGENSHKFNPPVHFSSCLSTLFCVWIFLHSIYLLLDLFLPYLPPFLFCPFHLRPLCRFFLRPNMDFHLPIAAGLKNQCLIPENTPHIPGKHFPEAHAIVGIKTTQCDRRNNRNRHVTAKGQSNLLIQEKYNSASVISLLIFHPPSPALWTGAFLSNAENPLMCIKISATPLSRSLPPFRSESSWSCGVP